MKKIEEKKTNNFSLYKIEEEKEHS